MTLLRTKWYRYEFIFPDKKAKKLGINVPTYRGTLLLLIFSTHLYGKRSTLKIGYMIWLGTYYIINEIISDISKLPNVHPEEILLEEFFKAIGYCGL